MNESDPENSTAEWGLSHDDLASGELIYRDGLLAGKTWIISGGGTGFGRAMAYACARLGANVMICGRRLEKLQETADAIRRHVGREVATMAMTIRDPEAVGQLMDAAYARFGRVDTLVNNGGGAYPQAAIDFSVKGWLAVLDTNLNGTWYMMQAAARRWRDRGEAGNIVNIVANVWRGMPQLAHSCAARAGVIYLSKTLSTEWAPHRIRVNCVSAGPFNSEGMNAYARSDAEKFRYSNPLHEFGDPRDLAQAVIFLSTSAAKFVTGEVVVMDGGNNQTGDLWPAGIPDYFRTPGP
jgi:citronellol/citronellal dehydrogenase